jgi:hypothetical protein
MAKFNFINNSPISKSVQKSEEKTEKDYSMTSEASEKNEDIDLSFTSTESFFEKAEIEDRDISSESFITASEKPSKVEEKEEYKFKSYFDDESVLDSFKPKIFDNKLFLFFAGAAVILLIIIFVLYQFIKGDGDVVDLSQPPPSTVTEERESSPVPSPVPPPEQKMTPSLTPIFQQTTYSNRIVKNNLLNLFSKQPNSGDYTLIVLTPAEINLTILGNSRNQVTNFNSALIKAFPNFGFKVISMHSKYDGNREFFHADLVGKIAPSTSTSQPISPSQPISEKDVSSVFQNLTKRNDLKIENFNGGKVTDRSSYRERFYYITLRAKKENIIKLVTQIAETYPMFQITKLSVHSYDLGIISDRDIITRLNFTFISAK